MTAQCPHEAGNVTDHSFAPGQHDPFIQFLHALETFVLILWVKLQEADGMGTLFTWGVPKHIHFVYEGQNPALYSYLRCLGLKTLLF